MQHSSDHAKLSIGDQLQKAIAGDFLGLSKAYLPRKKSRSSSHWKHANFLSFSDKNERVFDQNKKKREAFFDRLLSLETLFWMVGNKLHFPLGRFRLLALTQTIPLDHLDFRTKTRFPLPCAPYWTWWQCCLNSQGTLLFFSAFSWYNEKLALRFLTAWRILYFGPRLVNKHWLPNGADSPSCSRNVKHLFSFMYVVIIVIRIN